MAREKMDDTKSTNPLNQDEIQIYLKDIRKFKVMTPERERVLSQRIMSDNCSENEREKIYKELLEGNLRFVITVAKQYQNQGIDLADLIAEHTGQKAETIQADSDRDRWFTAEAAKEYGFVDHVVRSANQVSGNGGTA